MPLPVPIKSIPFNKCWKKKVAYILRIFEFFKLFFPLTMLDSSPCYSTHCLITEHELVIASCLVGWRGGRGHFTDSDKLLWNDRSLVFSWVCETFLTASSHHQHECKSSLISHRTLQISLKTSVECTEPTVFLTLLSKTWRLTTGQFGVWCQHAHQPFSRALWKWRWFLVLFMSS